MVAGVGAPEVRGGTGSTGRRVAVAAVEVACLSAPVIDLIESDNDGCVTFLSICHISFCLFLCYFGRYC